MLKAHDLLSTFSAAMIVLSAGSACGQRYPNKPIRIVTSGIGTGSDFVARLVAPGLSVSLAQPVVVDNRGSGVIPGEIVSKASPDGYSLLLYAAPLWIGPLLEPAPYDPIRDFSPISMVATSPNVLVVYPLLPVKSVKELVALAKARPGQLNYSSSAAGSTNHLSAELFKAMAGVDIVRIPYKSGSAQMIDLIAGQVQLTFSNAGTVVPHIKSGRIRALAVTGGQPSALLPELPTIAASGVPGMASYEALSVNGLFAPAKTPATIINRLNHELVGYLSQPDVRQRFLDSGVEAASSSPAELAAKIKAEITRLGKVIRDAGIKAE